MTEEGFPRLNPQLITLIVVLGVLVGITAAIRLPSTEPVSPDAGQDGEATPSPAFASYFVDVFPGRTADRSRPRSGTPIRQESRFSTGEEVGLRAETAPGITRPLVLSVRFLERGTREELPSLRDDRQEFRVHPGPRTYCCLRMPQETGDYALALIVDQRFLADIPVAVTAPKPQR